MKCDCEDCAFRGMEKCEHRKLMDEVNLQMIDQAKRMQEMEGQCLKYKGMRGVKQENVKFPNEERVRLNELILEAMDCPRDPSAFDIVHSASVYGGFKGKF